MNGPSSSRKRPFPDDLDESNKQQQKKVRFPKGKKVKAGEAPVQEPVVEVAAAVSVPPDFSDPRIAALERARRRGHMTTKLFTDDAADVDVSRISAAEVAYQSNDTFDDDGIQMEPFNLEQEREEGYFDESGNFVEFVTEKDKDAWFDSVEVDPKLAERLSKIPQKMDDEQEFTPDDVGKMKRRIANVLEPGETVMQALKRLKGNPSDKKAKMSAEKKLIFDQLTEDAMRLMENGEYNVYYEEMEVFEREAEGYEKLARIRNGEDTLDMFADEDNDVAAKSEQNNGTSVTCEGSSAQVEEGIQDHGGSWAGQSDYVYDETSGYYYSSSLGYYYDPSTALYCSASTGQWYKYDEGTGTYDGVQPAVDTTSAAS